MDENTMVDIRIIARKETFSNTVCLSAWGRTLKGEHVCVTGIVHTAYNPADRNPAPYEFHLSYEEAQVLMDSLWDCGLRPTEGAGSAGAMAATQEHLKSLKEESVWLRSVVDWLLDDE